MNYDVMIVGGSTPSRMNEAFITPARNAAPGDLSLVLSRRIRNGIIEMVCALDKVAPGTASGVHVAGNIAN